MVSAVASQRDGSRSVLCMRELSERMKQVQKRNESINQVENVALSLKRCVFLVLQTRRHFRGPIQKASLAKLIFFFLWFQANAGISVWESKLSLTLSQSQVEDLKPRSVYNHAAPQISRDARLAAAWKQEWELAGPSRTRRCIREPADGATGGDDPRCRQRATEARAYRGRSLQCGDPDQTISTWVQRRWTGSETPSWTSNVTWKKKNRGNSLKRIWSRAGLFQINPSFCCSGTCRLSGEDDPPPVRPLMQLRWELLWGLLIFLLCLQLEVLLKIYQLTWLK